MSLRRTGEGIQWTLNAYYNDYSDYIYANPTGEIAGRSARVRVSAGWREIARLRSGSDLAAAVAGRGHLDLHLASDYVRGELDGGGDLPQIPPLRFGAGLHYELDRCHLGVQGFYYDEQDKIAVNELPTDSFVLLDADASYRLPVGSSSVFLFLRASNLLDEDARQHASPLKDIAPLPGRSFHVGARAEF